MVQLLHLTPGSRLYNYIHDSFTNGWLHPGKTAEITDLFYVVPDKTGHEKAYSDRYTAHLVDVKRRTSGAVSYLFHGSQRACMIGEDASHLTTCPNKDCHICSILRCSWKLSAVSPHNMFGRGFYTSPTSSKADGYAKNAHIHSKKHAIILGNVTTGRKEILYHATPQKQQPSPGFDSCEAATVSQGGSVNYIENIVYREDAIIPTAVVMYKRKGWEPMT